MKTLVIFAVLIGVASCISVKDKLLSQLHTYEEKLVEAVEFSTAHALNFHRSVYESLLLSLFEHQETVNDLKNQTQESQIPIFFGTIDKFEKTVLSKIQNPSDSETTKASAIYLAAFKAGENDHVHSAKLLSDVKTIIRQVALINGFPNGVPNQPERVRTSMLSQLNDLYSKLAVDLKGVPSFSDFYDRANKTRAKIVSYDKYTLHEEANKLRAQLAKYDNTTLALARAWPIDTEAAADHYFLLAETHHTLELTLELPKNLPKESIKDRLMNIVDAEERKVTAAVVQLERDSLNYYAQRLWALHDYFNHTRSMVRSLPDDVDESRAYWEKQNVDSMVTTVTMEIRNNAPEKKVKARALYLAATKSLAPPDDSVLSPAELKTEVQAIVDKENSYLSKNATVDERRLSLSYRVDLLEMVNKLAKRLESHVIPGPEENRKLEERAQQLLLYYKKSGNPQGDVLYLEKEIHALHDGTHLLNSLLPIDNADKIAQFFKASLVHFEPAAKIQRRFMKIPV